jgi:low temperature requirement protein LtrA
MATIARFLDPPRLRTLETESDRRATWLELFFDLVFVVAIAELGTALSGEPTAVGFLKYAALFAPVWWAWAGFTFYANRFDTDDLLYRVLVLVGMFAVAAFATTVPDAFHGDSTGFPVAYASVRIVLLVLYARAIRYVPEARALATLYFSAFGVAVGIWLGSLAFEEPARYWLWGLALSIELAAPIFGWRLIPRAPIDVTHVPERFGLLTIIVLGESVLAVVIGVRNVSWDLPAAVAAAGGFLAAAAIWWVYFDFLDSSMVRRSILSGLVFVYAHFPVVVGIAAMGVGVRLAILSVGDGAKYDDTGWVFALGIAICMVGLAAIQLATPPAVFDADVLLRLATGVFAAVLAVLSSFLSPLVIVWLGAAALAGQVLLELSGHEAHARG